LKDWLRTVAQREREAAISSGEVHCDATAESAETLIRAETVSAVTRFIIAAPLVADRCCELLIALQGSSLEWTYRELNEPAAKPSENLSTGGRRLRPMMPLSGRRS